MTDNDIIKALENCMTPNNVCGDCSLRKECDNNPRTLENYALDLINRQKAEIERLKCALHKYIDKDDIKEIEMYEALAETRVNAIKEFAERLEDLSTERLLYEGYDERKLENIILCTDIDNLVKEMAGE